MPRGGYHAHAERWGRTKAWRDASPTKTIRVPEALAEQVLEIAHKIDGGELLAFATESEQLKQKLDAAKSEIIALKLALKTAREASQDSAVTSAFRG